MLYFRPSKKTIVLSIASPTDESEVAVISGAGIPGMVMARYGGSLPD